MIRIAVCPAGFLEANCYLAWNEETKDGFMVDPGDSADELEAFAREYGVKVKAILLTHGHFDHIGAAEQISEDLKAPIFSGIQEETVLADPFYNLSGRYTRKPFAVKADRLLSDREEFSLAGYRIRTIHTPGHSMGGVCYEVLQEGILFSGDTLFEGSYGRTDGPGGDYEAMLRSLARLFTELPGEMNVLPGHGGTTTIQRELRTNPALWDLKERHYL